MLKSRLITALILIPLVVITLFWLSPGAFTCAAFIVCILAAWEWGQLAGYAGKYQRIGVAAFFGLLLLLLWSLLNKQYVGPLVYHSILWCSLIWWGVAFFLVLFYPLSARVWGRSRLLRLILGLLTILPFFCGMLMLRFYQYPTDPLSGAWWLLYVMLLVWGADTGAYIFGKCFGKHKLMPRVSPGKTWEGCMGGLITAAGMAWLSGVIIPLEISTGFLLACSVPAALASILGDLTESMFKRETGIKDSSRLIPGHGGVLDRIDSLTAAIPVFTCLLLLVFQTR